MSITPTFTDINGREIVCQFHEQDGFEYLSIEAVTESGELERLMLLNMYDAKKLNVATEIFMQRTIAQNFSSMNGQLTPADRHGLYGEEE